MPPYKEQGIVLRSYKLGEADKIVTVMTQGSGKVRAVAKGIRKTKSRFGARLEPFTHVDLMLYRGRGALDTVTQAEIIAPHMAIRADLSLFAAGETMLEAVDRVAEEHERNVRLTLLLLAGCRALDATPADPAAVAESFMLKLLSLSGFHPSLTACAVCGDRDPQLWDAGLGGAVCSRCAEPGAGPCSRAALDHLAALASADLSDAGAIVESGPRVRVAPEARVRKETPEARVREETPEARVRKETPEARVRKETRRLLYGFAEYHFERRMKSVPMLVRTAT